MNLSLSLMVNVDEMDGKLPDQGGKTSLV
jgi:hypothetical protein